jgi:predicted phosphodiesterase
MRIAVICDIHGNAPALEAVLADVQGSAADMVVVAGDVVPGPLPAASMDVLMACRHPMRFVHGNGEVDIVSLHRGEEPKAVPEAVRPALEWTLSKLDSGHLEAMGAWSRTVRIPMPGVGDLVVCHATPRDEREIFTKLTPEARLREVFDPLGARLVVCGHTHMQFDRWVGSTRVVNAGSVGMPFGEPGAYWALVEPGGVTLRRTRYDLVDAEARIRASGYPDPPGFDVRSPPTEGQMLTALEAAALR